MNYMVKNILLVAVVVSIVFIMVIKGLPYAFPFLMASIAFGGYLTYTQKDVPIKDEKKKRIKQRSVILAVSVVLSIVLYIAMSVPFLFSIVGAYLILSLALKLKQIFISSKQE